MKEFEEGKRDIVIGREMIWKGVDLEGVSVVGIVKGNWMMKYGDLGW